MEGAAQATGRATSARSYLLCSPQHRSALPSNSARAPLWAESNQMSQDSLDLIAADLWAAQVLAGGGEMGALIRAFDWSATSIGPISTWPPSLRTAVGIVVSTGHPMLIFWGSDLIQLYNDAFGRSLASERHPSALGQKGRECWGEIWATIGPEIDAAMRRGEASWHENRLISITRGGGLRDLYWSYSYSPIPDEAGVAGGVLVTMQETTRHVASERRGRLLLALTTRELDAGSKAEAYAAAITSFDAYPDDVAFALVYARDSALDAFHLEAASGLVAGSRAAPLTIGASDTTIWPLAHALAEGRPVVVTDVVGTIGDFQRSRESEPVREALLLPLGAGTDASGADIVLVVGTNPRYPLDNDYRSFLGLAARELSAALIQARGVEQQRLARRALEEAEARLTRVFELSPSFFAVLRGPEHIFELSNPAYDRLVGYRPLLGLTIREALPDIAGQGFYEILQGVYQTGEPFVGNELPARMQPTPDVPLRLRYLNVICQPMRDTDGAVSGVLASGHDVTDLVLARETARLFAAERDLERRQLLTVLEQSPLAIVMVDAPCGQVRFVNARVAEIFGQVVTTDRFAEYSEMWRGVRPDGRPITAAEWPLARALLHGELIRNERVTILDAGNQRVEITINAAPVRDAQGQIIAAVAMFWDVTSERRIERQLRDAQRLQSVGTLAGGVAHEVNNQMTAVLGFGEFILRALGPDHAQAADLRVVLKAASRASLITHQLLTFTRQQLTQPRIVDLHAVATDLAPVLRQLLGSDKSLLILPSHTSCRATVDPAQLEQVLINLVANARDATVTGGGVTISVADAELTDAAAGRYGFPIVPGAYVLLTVSDTGHGMDEETLARVFEPFFTTKSVGEGTGLGLSMVYGIVKRHGGYVWAESTPGDGTAFRLYWPASASAPDPDTTERLASAGAERHPKNGNGMVLVVEDQAAVRELTARVLTAEGFQVVAAEDGQAALERLRTDTTRPRLIVTDVVMPRVNGRQLSEAVALVHPGVPVLFISGYARDDVLLRTLVPAGAPFLQKPFTPAQLVSVVLALLEPVTASG